MAETTTTSSKSEIRDVLEALDEQVGHYRRLAKLAQIQHAHVQQNQTEALLDVLKSRQEVLSEIGRLEHVVAPAKREWRGFVEGVQAQERGRAEALMSEAKQLLEAITRSDQNDALVLQQRKLNLGRQINQASAARQVNRNYAAAAYGNAGSRMDVQQ